MERRNERQYNVIKKVSYITLDCREKINEVYMDNRGILGDNGFQILVLDNVYPTGIIVKNYLLTFFTFMTKSSI